MSVRSRDLSSRVSEGQDIIDTRDIVERIKELEDERAAIETAAKEAHGTETPEANARVAAALTEWDDGDEAEELKVLLQVREDYCGSEDFENGEALIADHYFEEYAEELAENIGAITKGATWPNDCIDWKRAAEQLQQDYSPLDYGQTTYWFRS